MISLGTYCNLVAVFVEEACSISNNGEQIYTQVVLCITLKVFLQQEDENAYKCKVESNLKRK